MIVNILKWWNSVFFWQWIKQQSCRKIKVYQRNKNRRAEKETNKKIRGIFVHNKIGLCSSHALFVSVLLKRRETEHSLDFLSFSHRHHPHHHHPFLLHNHIHNLSVSSFILFLHLLPWLLLKQG